MNASADLHPPYFTIFQSLVRSVQCALNEFVSDEAGLISGGSAGSVADEQLNRHFAWLADVYRTRGVDRHLLDGDDELAPLLTKRILRPDDNLRGLLISRQSVPSQYLSGNRDTKASERWVQTEPTRISELIRQAVRVLVEPEKQQDLAHVLLPSPVGIVFNFLTVPNLPGTEAYALYAMKAYLFDLVGVYPGGIADVGGDSSFSERQLADALAHIHTSIRSRFESRGADKLPAKGQQKIGTVLRQYLAAKGYFRLRFTDAGSAKRYCNSHNLPIEGFEFDKSPQLDHLPDEGEIANELWGIPLPLRGTETIFRGGLKFSSRGGLAMAIHGGPGSGKTSLALGLAASLAPFGIRCIYLTVEENEADLRNRVQALVPESIRRLSFFESLRRSGAQDVTADWLKIVGPTGEKTEPNEILDKINFTLAELGNVLNVHATRRQATAFGMPRVCRAVVVMDGLQDLIASTEKPDSNNYSEAFQRVISQFKSLQAFVVLTTGSDWARGSDVDYLVDVVARVNHVSLAEFGLKPQRQFLLSKARQQLCAPGTHGFSLAGEKGIRFSPQVSYQLERRAVWKARLHDTTRYKVLFRRLWDRDQLEKIRRRGGIEFEVSENEGGVRLFVGSHIFINGRGSGGKAALALKVVASPVFSTIAAALDSAPEKVLIVSFLYPKEYYSELLDEIERRREREYPELKGMMIRPAIVVERLYPGHLLPSDLFNKISWTLRAAELRGRPFTSVILDGLHNVFIQFPELEKNNLIWPQIYSYLRTMPLNVITTHTTLELTDAVSNRIRSPIDDGRSEPLRHALVQKTDFQFDVDPINDGSGLFQIAVRSAVGQVVSQSEMFWDRESLSLFGSKQAGRAVESVRFRRSNRRNDPGLFGG